jgi:hypothetical protein
VSLCTGIRYATGFLLLGKPLPLCSTVFPCPRFFCTCSAVSALCVWEISHPPVAPLSSRGWERKDTAAPGLLRIPCSPRAAAHRHRSVPACRAARYA